MTSIGPQALHSKTLRVVAGWVVAAFVLGGSAAVWRLTLVTKSEMGDMVAGGILDAKRTTTEIMQLQHRCELLEARLSDTRDELHAARRTLVQYHAQRTCPSHMPDAASRALKRFDDDVSGKNDEATAFQTVLFLKWCP